jgi:hypothetical protein
MIQDRDALAVDTTILNGTTFGGIENAACTAVTQARPSSRAALFLATADTQTSAGNEEVMRSLGFYGGIALAVALGLMDPPGGLLMGITPLLRTMVQPHTPAEGALTHVFEGAAQPLGIEAVTPVATQLAGPVIQRSLRTLAGRTLAEVRSMWADAQAMREHES